MKMNKKLKTFALLAILSGSIHLSAQDYTPDVSLTYQAFLDQCIQFKNQSQKQAWVVFFWAGWNSSSLYAIPPLKSLHSAYQGKPVRFVSISVEKIRSKWEKDLTRYQMPWEHLLIPREDDYNFLKRAFPHKSLPGMFVVKPDGMIHQAMTEAELEKLLADATASLPNTPYQAPVRPVAETESAETTTPRPEPEKPAPAVPTANVSPAPAPSPAGAWLTHTVQSGETLFSLFRRYQVPVNEIKQINGLTTNNIQVGQVLKIKRR